MMRSYTFGKYCSDSRRHLPAPLQSLILAIMLALLVSCGGSSEDEASATDGQQPDATSATNQQKDQADIETGNAGEETLLQTSSAEVVPAEINVSDFVLVSSRRVTRTRMEFTVRVKISNGTSDKYEDVTASLIDVPGHIEVIDGVVNVGNVTGNSVITSIDTFTFIADLTNLTDFGEFNWNITGNATTPPPPPGPGDSPERRGIFMSIDNNVIQGDSDSSSHDGWIVLSSYSAGINRQHDSLAGTTRSRSSFELDDVVVGKLLDRSSPELRQALLQGQVFGEVQIDIIGICDENLYTKYAITLNTARLSGIEIAGTGTDLPHEEVAIDFTRITTMYTPVAGDCSLESPIMSTQDGQIIGL